ncbi:MAG: hypothetical protein GXC73_07060 [Chitinophagaceae bacterium]|nr:hypothetical protein [Chitinophagaceae bacterium]
MNLTQLTLEIHVLIFAGFLLIVGLIGFLYGRKQVKNKERRILELEDEMLAAHKEILHFAKTNKQLAETLEKAKIPYPVTRIDEDEDEKVRKIPLGKIG